MEANKEWSDLRLDASTLPKYGPPYIELPSVESGVLSEVLEGDKSVGVSGRRGGRVKGEDGEGGALNPGQRGDEVPSDEVLIVGMVGDMVRQRNPEGMVK